MRPEKMTLSNTAGSFFAYNDVTGLKYKLPTAYRALATYVASSKGLQLLEQLKDSNGRPIFRESLVEDGRDRGQAGAGEAAVSPSPGSE